MAEFTREVQPGGDAGIEYSVNKMIELINKDRTDPAIVAFSRRVLRDAGLVGNGNQDPVKVHRAIFDAINTLGIDWVPDPIKSEFLAAPRHFIPSEEGRDDALMVAGDCDELTMLQAALGAACALSVGVETSALCLHSYSPNKKIVHVLNAVFDPSTGHWIRVDHTPGGAFGEYKTPTHEILISLPSGRVICDGSRCDLAKPAPVEDGTPWVHGRLDGIPGEAFGALDVGAPEGAEYDEETLSSFANILDLNEWDLLSAVKDFEQAYTSLVSFFDRMGFSFEEREKYWPATREAEADDALFAAEIVAAAIHETRIGARPWAIDEDGNYAILRVAGETQAIDNTGNIINVLSGFPAARPSAGAALGEALPLPPWAIVALSAGAVLITVGGFWALVQVVRSLADMARSAEIRASAEVVGECLKNNDAERCGKLAKGLAEVRSSREQADADKARAEADKAKETTRQIAMGLAVAAAGVAAGGFVYFGGPAVVSGWLASRRKAAA